MAIPALRGRAGPQASCVAPVRLRKYVRACKGLARDVTVRGGPSGPRPPGDALRDGADGLGAWGSEKRYGEQR